MENWANYKRKIFDDAVNVKEYIEMNKEQFIETISWYMAAALRKPKLQSWNDFPISEKQ